MWEEAVAVNRDRLADPIVPSGLGWILYTPRGESHVATGQYRWRTQPAQVPGRTDAGPHDQSSTGRVVVRCTYKGQRGGSFSFSPCAPLRWNPESYRPLPASPPSSAEPRNSPWMLVSALRSARKSTSLGPLGSQSLSVVTRLVYLRANPCKAECTVDRDGF